MLKLSYVPLQQRYPERTFAIPGPKLHEAVGSGTSRFAAVPNEDFSQATKALYEREVARGISENEEIFAGEEEVSSLSKPQWANKHRPRKPRYFNRVQMGYEWNKYNQTHYDHDNPPPKVVQGYKFNIFYPDLIDKSKAPTYRIERENGRKRGQSFAPAGEEDTCLIRFISGPPYEDLAFRIVDKEWDYSAKRERGFRSSFDKVSMVTTFYQWVPGDGDITHAQETNRVSIHLGNIATPLPVQKGLSSFKSLENLTVVTDSLQIRSTIGNRFTAFSVPRLSSSLATGR